MCKLGDLMRLVYHIDEGPQTRVKRILMTGYNHTRAGVIRREIRVKPNAPLREGEVVESQRRLVQPGSFQSRDDRAAESERHRTRIRT